MYVGGGGGGGGAFGGVGILRGGEGERRKFLGNKTRRGFRLFGT